MIMIVSQQSSMVTQLSLNLTPKQQLTKLPKLDERLLIAGHYLMIVNNYKIRIILNDILNPEHPIVIIQVKSWPKD